MPEEHDLLRRLVEINYDSREGFRLAAEHAQDADLRSLFTDLSSERLRFATELQSELTRLGGPMVDKEGSLAGRLHRTWIDLKDALGAGDDQILSSVQQGEEAARRLYEEAVAQNLAPHARDLVKRQLAGILALQDHVRLLRERRRAA